MSSKAAKCSKPEAMAVHMNQVFVPGNVKLQFKLYNAWPGAYALTDLNAGDNGILIQSMTVHHEGFYIDWAGDDDLTVK